MDAHDCPPPTGVDCLGCLLGLAINAAAPLPLAAAAFQALLAHPELVAALTAAEGVDEDELARQQEEAALQASGSAGSGGGSSSSEAAVLLEQVGVRPELAGVVGSGLGGVGASSGGSGSGGGRHPRFLEGWGLLVGHMLAAAPESHGRRLLSQTLKEIHDMVPSLLDTVVQLLPLQQGGSGRRDSSGGASGGTPPPRTASVGEAAAAAVGPDSGGAARAADPGAAFTSALAALDLPLVLDHPQQQQQQQGQQQAQRLAALLYWGVLQALPASARLWFSDLRDRALAAAVERYTAAAVTQALLAAELAAVASLASTFGKYDKFSVRASATAREVVAGRGHGRVLGSAWVAWAVFTVQLENETEQRVHAREGRGACDCVQLPCCPVWLMLLPLLLCCCCSDGGGGGAPAGAGCAASCQHAAEATRGGVPPQGEWAWAGWHLHGDAGCVRTSC